MVKLEATRNGFEGEAPVLAFLISGNDKRRDFKASKEFKADTEDCYEVGTLLYVCSIA